MLENYSNIQNNVNLIILFKIILAALLAFVPGMERELTGKFAGLRTHILVCTGACVYTILSLYGFDVNSGVTGHVIVQNDPARIAAQVITGIGFIGAGTVMRHGSNVSGITTAATLWMCAAIGMSCGCGEYFTAIVASIVTLIVLILIRRLEKNIISKRKVSYGIYDVTISAPIESCDSIQDNITSNFHKVYKINKKLTNHEQLKYSATISTKKNLKEINDIFKKIDNIESIEIKESYE